MAGRPSLHPLLAVHSLKGEVLTRRQCRQKGRKDDRPTPVLKFRSSLFKGLRFPKAEPWSPSAEGETPLNGIFFLLSFFFCACYGQKKKRRSLFADIISVHKTAAGSACTQTSRIIHRKVKSSPGADVVKRVRLSITLRFFEV